MNMTISTTLDEALTAKGSGTQVYNRRYAYILRTCNADLTSYNGFQWPSTGVVVAPDWDPKPECGNGLHGALNGEGDGSLFKWEPDAKWLVIKVFAKSVVN